MHFIAMQFLSLDEKTHHKIKFLSLIGGFMSLRDWLYFKRMTIKDFAQHMGICRMHASNIVNQRLRPGERLAKDIEQFTGGEITREELLGFEINKRQKKSL